MKRLLVLLFLLFPTIVYSEEYAHFFSVVRNSTGDIVPTATITVYLANTVTLATIYSNNTGTIKSNPFLSEVDGNYGFWVNPGSYKINVNKVGVGSFTSDYIQIGTASHAWNHETNNGDELELSNIDGTLPDAQKIEVLEEGVTKGTRNKVDFKDSSTVQTTITDNSGSGKIEVSNSIVSNSLTSSEIGEDSVGASELGDNSVANANVLPNAAIDESKLNLNFSTHDNTNDPSSGQKAALVGTFGTPGSGNKYVTDGDSRLSDDRTPVLHATSHSNGGADEIVVDVSQLTSIGSGTDLTADLEEETHSTEHSNGGADEISVENLGTGCSIGEVAVSDGSGGLDCGSSGSGSPIIFDAGNNGSNESTSIEKITTEQDIYGAVSEVVADEVHINLSKVAPYALVDPLKPPESAGTGGCIETFAGSTEVCTWEWANQDSATIAYNQGGSLLVGDTNNELHVRGIVAATNADQTFTVRINNWYDGSSTTNDSCGAFAVTGGTLEVPTEVRFTSVGDFATDGLYWIVDTDYNPASGTTVHGSVSWDLTTLRSVYVCHQLRYIDSSRELTMWYSTGPECTDFTQLSIPVTMAADPTHFGFYVRREGPCRVQRAQLRTDTNKDVWGTP